MNNIQYIIWLDDCRDPFDLKMKWVEFTTNCILPPYRVNWVKTVEEFKGAVMRKFPDVVCLDHDLGEGESGMDAAKWLVDYCLDTGKLLPAFYSQSSNPAGRENILAILKSFRKFQMSQNGRN